MARWAGTCRGRSFPARWAGLGEWLARWAGKQLPVALHTLGPAGRELGPAGRGLVWGSADPDGVSAHRCGCLPTNAQRGGHFGPHSRRAGFDGRERIVIWRVDCDANGTCISGGAAVRDGRTTDRHCRSSGAAKNPVRGPVRKLRFLPLLHTRRPQKSHRWDSSTTG